MIKTFITIVIVLLTFAAQCQNVALLDQINGFKKVKMGMTPQQVKANDFKELFGCPLPINPTEQIVKYEYYKGKLYVIKLMFEGECSLDVYNNLKELFDIKKPVEGMKSGSFTVDGNKIDLMVVYLQEPEDYNTPTCFIRLIDLPTHKAIKREEKQRKINEITN